MAHGWDHTATFRGKAHALRAGVVVAALIGLAATSGCSPIRGVRDQWAYSNGLYQTTSRMRIGWRAHQAWTKYSPQFLDEPCLGDFAAGFKQGYHDVANGEDGCPPPVPPRKYWSARFENPEGQSCIAAWFAGYPHGARAAFQDRAGEFRVIRPSDPLQQRHEWRMAEYYGDDIYATPYDDIDALDLDALDLDASADGVPRQMASPQDRLEPLPPATPRFTPRPNGPQQNGPTPPPEIRAPESRPKETSPREPLPSDTTRLRRRVDISPR